ncbi:kinesin-like protein KIF20B isoform X2 [Phyllopteryx taeniolatus]|uniref:kinesin-like protein KIF20B isoform X2 n=1 Tax=Phyllopteryx taeniolatus TaxID=161469 RepID=UPI002AD2D48E|nr:kinesin-like protein KIF20B isoform X2 [Phyllopteryx taeniolatus]
MESCLAGRPERIGPVEVNDIKRDLLDEFSALPKQEEVPSRSENLQVYLRVRPLTGAETGESQDCVAIEGPHTVVLKAPRSRQADKIPPQTAQRFTFTQVFGPDASQRKVFEGSVRSLVRDVLRGENCLLFTYGVTNAGKTFTFLGPDHDSGLLPRCLRVIFNSTEGRLYDGCDLKPHRCRDFVRLTADQQRAESAGKTGLLRTVREIDKNATARSTSLDASSLSSDCSASGVSESDRFALEVAANVRFSVWVSFCEIYNDNIHDLLEQVAGGHVKRTVLRLSQDIKGNSFIRDLKWIQVSSPEEAYKVVKIGRKNQSLASTKLNHQSSRSHSIFSIRILRADDSAVPRFLGVSELALCDLAGSERCSRTRNTGERLKEAGNINSSLLALGKCIHAMRVKQNAKFQHHVPFRESKLTHFLQFFFCGAGKVSMVVNISQNSSCVDETLNVLKFSALAQKVVVLNSQPAGLDDSSLRSAMEVSVLIDRADRRRNLLARGRKSSMVAWETTLEDVMEDDDGGEEDAEDEESGMEETVLKAEEEDGDGEETMEEEVKLDREAAFRLVVEAKIREEVCGEFMEIFNKMERDYSERLERERQILEERAETRLLIQKNLFIRTAGLRPPQEEEGASLAEGIIRSVGEDLKKIRADAQSVHRQLLLANQEDEGPSAFHANMADLRRERRAAAESSARKSKIIQEVTQEKMRSDSKCERLAEELANQKAAYCRQIGELRAELEHQGAALRRKIDDDLARQQERRDRLRHPRDPCEEKRLRKWMDGWMDELERVVREKEALVEEHERQTDALRRELERRRHDEEREEKAVLADEPEEEMHRPWERRRQEEPSVCAQPEVSPFNAIQSKGKSSARKRKSCQVEGLSSSDNKRANIRSVTQQKASPSVLSSAAKSVFGLVGSVTMAAKPKRGRRKLYGKEEAAPLIISPHATCTAADADEKESDHMIMKRQLRSKTGRK